MFKKYEKLLTYLKEHIIFSKLKIAVIADSPDKVVFPIIGANNTGLQIKPFATIEAGVRWIIN